MALLCSALVAQGELNTMFVGLQSSHTHILYHRILLRNDGQNEESGKPKTGIFVRNPTITIPVQPIMDIQVKAARGGTVPQPNNLDTDFIE